MPKLASEMESGEDAKSDHEIIYCDYARGWVTSDSAERNIEVVDLARSELAGEIADEFIKFCEKVWPAIKGHYSSLTRELL